MGPVCHSCADDSLLKKIYQYLVQAFFTKAEKAVAIQVIMSYGQVASVDGDIHYQRHCLFILICIEKVDSIINEAEKKNDFLIMSSCESIANSRLNVIEGMNHDI